MKTEALKQKLEELRTPLAKTETRPAKGDESGSLYARHLAEAFARLIEKALEKEKRK